ncbi:shikimate dehydrogenase [Verrucomicrobiota bacterium sgz303538]
MPKEVYEFSDLQNWNSATADAEPPLRLAVFGDPVAHSASPPMHNAALEKCGIPARYTRLHIRPEELAEAFRLLPAQGFLGVNVTIPHKAAALQLMNRVDDHARRIGVVNTVVVEGNELVGFNTDGPGLVRAVKAEFGVDLRDLRVMVLGAGGGAGRAIAMQCGIEECERLVLVNRTLEKVRELAAELEPLFAGPRVSGPVARLEAIPWEEADLRFQLAHTDLVINCTSLGMKRTDASPLPSSVLQPHLMLYDTIYTANRTKLMQAADEVGARSANGFSMLLHQGALAFEIWFNREAPLDVMRAALLEHARRS